MQCQSPARAIRSGSVEHEAVRKARGYANEWQCRSGRGIGNTGVEYSPPGGIGLLAPKRQVGAGLFLEPVANPASGAGADSSRSRNACRRLATARWCVAPRQAGSQDPRRQAACSRGLPPGPRSRTLPPRCRLRPRNGPGATYSTAPVDPRSWSPCGMHGHTRPLGRAGDKQARSWARLVAARRLMGSWKGRCRPAWPSGLGRLDACAPPHLDAGGVRLTSLAVP